MADPATPRLPDTYLYGSRLGWRDAPAVLRDEVVELIGAPVVACNDRVGGMSVGVASVLTAGGRDWFCKAVDARSNPDGGRMYEREAAIARQLPELPALPRFVGSGTAVGDTDRWAFNVYEAVPGQTVRHPWSARDTRRVLDAWVPVAHALRELRDFPDAGLADFFTGARTVAADTDDPWRSRLGTTRLTDWAARETQFADRIAGTDDPDRGAAHIDLRADNILLGARDTDVWFVDWAHPGLAAPWADALILLFDVIGSGGDRGEGGDVDVARVWAEHPACAPHDPALLAAGAASMAAKMHRLSLRPENPLLPHGRRWQAAFAEKILPFALRMT